jgi:Zn-dependent M28 family amino/carboxypeptidase
MSQTARSVWSVTVFAAVIATGLAVGGAAQSPAAIDDRAARPGPFSAADLIADIQTLASAPFEGRRAGTAGNAKARALIVDRFRSLGLTALTADYQMPFQFTRGGASERGVNVVGVCEGSGTGDDRLIVISAHYDHLGIRNGTLHPGADDNASGVAVMLGLAGHCRRTPWTHDVVFVAFDAEELGLQGARAFVAAPPVAKDRIALNVNFDMVSRSATREVYVAGTHHWPALRQPVDAVAKRAPFTLLFGHDTPKAQSGGLADWTMQSDHGAFHAAGIPFLYFGVEDHPDYHRPTDTADKIDAAFVAQIAATVAEIVTALDRSLPARVQ